MSGPGSATSDGEIVGFTLAGLAVGAGLVAWGSAQITTAVGSGVTPPASPIKFALSLADGSYVWTGADTVVAAVLAAVLITVTTLVVLRVTGRHGRDHVDRRAQRLVRSPGLDAYTTTEPGQLGVDCPGPPIGRVLPTAAKTLRATWEDEIIEVSGPRTGKTMSRAIPVILDAPPSGALVVSSNKRDIVDRTRGPREGEGPLWLFDPQGIASGDATWWWNPLADVRSVRTADKLAAIWATAGRPADARADAYFDTAAKQLLGMMLLAAGSAARPVSDVYRWLAEPNDDTPLELLSEAGHGESERGLRSFQGLPDKQRAGVYGTTQSYVAWLADPEVLVWIVDPAGSRPRFDPVAFTRGTLYVLSKEGEGSSTPLVTALCAAVFEAAERRAARSPGGRLPIPLLGVLDEAANTCPWRELPDLVSHYGSRGIVLLLIVQTWAQGVGAWGQHGMSKLWNACNVAIYGGGSKDPEFLRMLSALCGDYEHETRSTSINSKSGRTTSVATRKEPVFDVASLTSMPKFRALVFLSGTRPVLIKSQGWWDGPHAEAVNASIARFDPTAVPTTPAPASQASSGSRRSRNWGRKATPAMNRDT